MYAIVHIHIMHTNTYFIYKIHMHTYMYIYMRVYMHRCMYNLDYAWVTNIND